MLKNIQKQLNFIYLNNDEHTHVDRSTPGGDTPILGHTGDVRPEWVSFRGPKLADGS